MIEKYRLKVKWVKNRDLSYNERKISFKAKMIEKYRSKLKWSNKNSLKLKWAKKIVWTYFLKIFQKNAKNTFKITINSKSVWNRLKAYEIV